MKKHFTRLICLLVFYTLNGQAIAQNEVEKDTDRQGLISRLIYDEKVARDIEDNIRRDMSDANSWTIAKRKKPPLRSLISGTLGAIVEAVPAVNVWPFTYSGSYKLKEGKKPVSNFHKDFYGHYKYVGPLPEVRGSGKEIEARLMKAFLGPIEPLI